MDSQYIDHALVLAGILFCLGLVGVMVRRNLIFIMISIDLSYDFSYDFLLISY